MNDIIHELYFIEECINNLTNKPTRETWISYLGDTYDKPGVETFVDGWLYCKEQAHACQQPDTNWVDHVLNVPQVEQRTDEWYKQAKTILTASEIWTLTKSPRERGLLVMSKATDEQTKRGGRQLCVPTEFMTAFDWGIRFEPVVKALYEFKYALTVKDVGRIVHRTDSRVAASPDGVVMGSPLKTQRLLEIKCPVSREIGLEIPPEYYAQMQTQMEVTGAPICDYVEVCLRTGYKKGTVLTEGPALGSGVVWRVQNEDGTEKYWYDYITYMGQTNILEGTPHEDACLERIEWDLLGWHEVEVTRDTTWWANMLQKVDAFWADVEAARAGDFVVAESSRKRRRIEEPEKCMIQFEATEATESSGT
jgi:hypothetical protein